jgi:hypothetical protein
MWYLRWFRGLDTRPEDRAPAGVMQLGTNVHLALEAYYGYGLDWGKTLTWVYDQLAAARPVDVKEIRGEQSYAMAMVEGYLGWAAENGVDQEYAVVGAEQVLSVPVTVSGTPVELTGRLDQTVRRADDGALLFRDWKTVGDLARDEKLKRNEQMRWYALLQWIDASETGAQRVDGGLYTMLKRSKRTARAAGPFYSMIQVRYNEYDHASMLARVREVVREVLSAEARLRDGEGHHSAAYPNPGDHCDWLCPFSSVCTLADDGSRFEDALTGTYQVVDPYGYHSSARIDEVRKALSA